MVFGFGDDSHWTVDEMPDQTGRVIIVTGANAGLGYVTTLELARKGAKVYMLCRAESRAQTAMESIRAEVPGAKLEFLPFDLCNLTSCRKAAEMFLQREVKLHAVVANAGIMATPYKLSVDGIEEQAHNAFGHFALIHPLISILKKTAREPNSHVRLVQVSSKGHEFATRNVDFASLESVNRPLSGPWERYGQSKLGNILFANELRKRLAADTNVHSLSVYPGGVDTGLFKGTEQSYPLLKPIIRAGVKMFMMTPADGTLTQLYAATSLEIESKDLNGAYLVPIAKVGKMSQLAADKDGKLGAAFWNLAEQLTRQRS